MSDEPEALTFEPIVTCENPMEAEIFPAALREAEIPHRTEWNKDGSLVILVASDWTEEAQTALDKAARIFFGQNHGDASTVEPNRATPSLAETAANDDALEQDVDQDPGSMFGNDAMPTPEETRIRTVWPAWVFAALPGLGLGHLYAGKMQMFFYLVFCSMLGALFFQFTGSYWAFGFIGFAWVVDLGFAAFHVRDHNRRAARARKRLEAAESEFLDSL
jgi:hypothetical protein